MDSGTKNKRLLRLLSVLLLAVLLVSVSSLAVLADGEEGPPAEDSSAVEVSDAAGGYVSAFPSGYPNVPQDATYGELLMYGLQVAGIGLLVVFLVLVIIMAILYIFKLVAVSKAKKASPAVAPAAASPAVAPKEASPAVAPASPAASGSEEETIVAIATAAIAASRGASDCAFKVISVTKIQ